MTVVIADSSPLNYLTLIGLVDVLHRLYGTVIVPQQVITELTDPAAPCSSQLFAQVTLQVPRARGVLQRGKKLPGTYAGRANRTTLQ